MKIQLVSDLHQEFEPIQLLNSGADVLVLSGDIIVAEYFTRGENSPKRAIAETWRAWFEYVCAQFEQVIYVLGNHEHYYGNFLTTETVLRTHLGHIKNLHIRHNAAYTIGEYKFYGATLWTNFDYDNFKAMMVRDGLNDYSLIKSRDYRKLSTAETALDHANALRILDSYSYWDKIVFCGHHAPSYRSITPEYATGRYAHLNAGYCSNLDSYIEARPNIKLWTHGHVHSSHDYMIGETRVVANPRGYATKGVPENKDFNPNLVLEV